MGAIDYVSIEQVDSPDLLTRYICQTTGTPWASGRDIGIVRKKCKEFFEQYPYLDYSALCHVADWVARRKKRYSHVWKVIDAFRYAYEDGALPEVDRRTKPDPQIEEEIDRALEVETDRVWRMRLIGTEDVNSRKEVLDAWLTMRKPVLL